MMEFKNKANEAELRALWKEAFGDSDDYLDLFFATAYSNERSMAAFIDNELAGALYWFDCELCGKKTSYIYAVATAKKHRGKGVCSGLLSHTHNYLQKNGYSLAILVPSEASLFEFYGKMGYVTCGFIDELELENCKGSTPTLQISSEEYFSLRKDFAPKNSPDLCDYHLFLNSVFEFFSGEDFIFCKAKGSSFLPEFLGNTKALPSVIASRFGTSAFVRTMGNKRPFCMGISLDDTPIDYSIYFPFAFD